MRTAILDTAEDDVGDFGQSADHARGRLRHRIQPVVLLFDVHGMTEEILAFSAKTKKLPGVEAVPLHTITGEQSSVQNLPRKHDLTEPAPFTGV